MSGFIVEMRNKLTFFRPVALFLAAPLAVKVSIAPAVAVMCLIVISGLGLWANYELIRSLQSMQAIKMPALSSVNEIQVRLGGVYAGINKSFVWASAGYKEKRIAELDGAIVEELRSIDGLIESQIKSEI